MVAGPRSGGACNGPLYRISLPHLPAREPENVFEGRPLLHGQVRHRAPAVPAGPARPGARQVLRVRRAVARETKSKAPLRAARVAVPRLLPARLGRQGQDGREPAPVPRAAPRQRRLPPRLRRHARRTPPPPPPRPPPPPPPQRQPPSLPPQRCPRPPR